MALRLLREEVCGTIGLLGSRTGTEWVCVMVVSSVWRMWCRGRGGMGCREGRGREPSKSLSEVLLVVEEARWC